MEETVMGDGIKRFGEVCINDINCIPILQVVKDFVPVRKQLCQRGSVLSKTMLSRRKNVLSFKEGYNSSPQHSLKNLNKVASESHRTIFSRICSTPPFVEWTNQYQQQIWWDNSLIK